MTDCDGALRTLELFSRYWLLLLFSNTRDILGSISLPSEQSRARELAIQPAKRPTLTWSSACSNGTMLKRHRRFMALQPHHIPKVPFQNVNFPPVASLVPFSI